VLAPGSPLPRAAALRFMHERAANRGSSTGLLMNERPLSGHAEAKVNDCYVGDC